MASIFLADLLGTLKSTFRIGPTTAPLTIDSSALTAARTLTAPDATGTVALGAASATASGNIATLDSTGKQLSDSGLQAGLARLGRQVAVTRNLPLP